MPLILFVVLGIIILVVFEVRARKQQKNNSEQTITDSESSDNQNNDEGCCGEHLVCERETLLQTNAKIEYYDDEELDEFDEPVQETAPRTRRPSPFATSSSAPAAPAATVPAAPAAFPILP